MEDVKPYGDSAATRISYLTKARLAIALAYSWNMSAHPLEAKNLLLAARTFIRCAQEARRTAS